MLFSFQFVLLRRVSAGILGTFYQPLVNIEEMRSGKGTEADDSVPATGRWE